MEILPLRARMILIMNYEQKVMIRRENTRGGIIDDDGLRGKGTSCHCTLQATAFRVGQCAAGMQRVHDSLSCCEPLDITKQDPDVNNILTEIEPVTFKAQSPGPDIPLLLNRLQIVTNHRCC